MSELPYSVFRMSGRRNYYVQWTNPETGKKETKSTGTTKKREADRFAADHIREVLEGSVSKRFDCTWEQFRTQYETEVLPGLAKSTGYCYAAIFNAIEDVLKPKRLNELTAKKISTLQAQMRAQNKSDETIRAYFAHLKKSLSWAVEMELLKAVPKISRPPRLKSGKKNTKMKGRPLTGEEFDRLVAKAVAKYGESWRHYLTGLWLSGLRLEESTALYWDRPDQLCVDLSHRRPMLSIPGELEKGNTDRLIPITPDFAEFLLQTPEAARTGRVFDPVGVKGKGSLSATYIGAVIRTLGQSAAIKVYTHPKTGKVKYASAHDFRRSFGARWAPHVMPTVLQELMRHEDIETTLRYYVALNVQRTAETVWDVPREFWETNTLANSGSKVSVSETPDNAVNHDS